MNTHTRSSILFNSQEKKDKINNSVLIISILLFLILGTVFYYLYAQKTAETRQQIAYVGELQKLSERVEKNAYLAQNANANSFKDLKNSANSIDTILNVLAKGGSVNSTDTAILPINESGRSELNKIIDSWNANKALLNSLLSQSANLTELKILVDKSVESNQAISDASFNLQKSIATLPNNVKYNEVMQEIVILFNRISGTNTALFSGENFSLTNGYSLVKDIKSISFYLSILSYGSEVYGLVPITNPEVTEQIRILQNAYTPYSSIVGKIAANVSVLNGAKELSKTIAYDTAQINAQTDQLEEVFEEKLNLNDIYFYVSGISFLILIMSMALYGIRIYRERNKAFKYAEIYKKNQANEEAVNNLLKLMAPLAKGDLTQPIAVKDRFIAPIAQGVDSTREILRAIISSLKRTVKSVVLEANAANQFSVEVLKDSGNQSKVMQQSIDKIGEITSEMEDVAQNTYFAKEDAINSEKISKEGLETVNSSIQKMNEIRDNIQESSKKIKRLGESSQSIARVTDLIRSITKEINVLAFNAAIEATAAGENGRAFSVMAQQVQRLAISSAQASKDIDDLIKEIQEDTANAVSAMEETTQQVVDGTRLNDQAGNILQQISGYSEKLADSITKVAEAIEEKSNEMVEVSLNVRQLQKINEKSIQQVTDTVQKVDTISKASEELTGFVEKYIVE